MKWFLAILFSVMAAGAYFLWFKEQPTATTTTTLHAILIDFSKVHALLADFSKVHALLTDFSKVHALLTDFS